MELSTNLRETANAGALMALRHPATGAEFVDAQGNRSALRVLGKDSDAVKRCEREWHRRIQKEAKTRRDATVTPEMWDEQALNLAVASVIGWEHCSYKGTTEYSPELVREFLRNEPWALEQVQEFQADRANFSGGSKTT